MLSDILQPHVHHDTYFLSTLTTLPLPTLPLCASILAVSIIAGGGGLTGILSGETNKLSLLCAISCLDLRLLRWLYTLCLSPLSIPTTIIGRDMISFSHPLSTSFHPSLFFPNQNFPPLTFSLIPSIFSPNGRDAGKPSAESRKYRRLRLLLLVP